MMDECSNRRARAPPGVVNERRLRGNAQRWAWQEQIEGITIECAAKFTSYNNGPANCVFQPKRSGIATIRCNYLIPLRIDLEIGCNLYHCSEQTFGFRLTSLAKTAYSSSSTTDVKPF
jgi:hypothetical protein